eukprot:TRINITY_DN3028_c0_g1_i2.p1 TRINITY_DN3028_c0_g1~~TRINITY_DN3028_c0_g1_i2.p1  ORF type:complete len:959 (+),score=205.78 TRINITY_DN3028_c0_g1_i2:108-2984(+)
MAGTQPVAEVVQGPVAGGGGARLLRVCGGAAASPPAPRRSSSFGFSRPLSAGASRGSPAAQRPSTGAEVELVVRGRSSVSGPPRGWPPGAGDSPSRPPGSLLSEWRQDLLKRRRQEDRAAPPRPLVSPGCGSTGLRFKHTACTPRLPSLPEPETPPRPPGGGGDGSPASPRLSTLAETPRAVRLAQLGGASGYPRVVYLSEAASEPSVAHDVAAWQAGRSGGGPGSGCGDPPAAPLGFDASFETGNLKSAVQVNEREYELELREDFGTTRYSQWFHFAVTGMQRGLKYTFRIINLVKAKSLYAEGLLPLGRWCSCREAALAVMLPDRPVGCDGRWQRLGDPVTYLPSKLLQPKKNRKMRARPFYMLSFTFEPPWPHQEGAPPPERWYFARCFPYSWSDLQRHLRHLEVTKPCVRSKVLCETIAGNECAVLTVTAPCHLPDELEKRPIIVLSARIHPGESMSSWMMRGVLDFLVSEQPEARRLRQLYCFTIVPMLNPDGVIAGCFRCSLFPSDLNRVWQYPDRECHPTVYHLKQLVERLKDAGREVRMYVDLHGHTRKRDLFVYGSAEGRSVAERIFPRMFQDMSPHSFLYSSCNFHVSRGKRGTGRVVMWRTLGVPLSYTLEASFAGPGPREGRGPRHWNENDLQQLGRDLCSTLHRFSLPDEHARVREQLVMEGVADGTPEQSSDGSTSQVASEDGDRQVKAARTGRLRLRIRRPGTGRRRERANSAEAPGTFSLSFSDAWPTTPPNSDLDAPGKGRRRRRGPHHGGQHCLERAQARGRSVTTTASSRPPTQGQSAARPAPVRPPALRTDESIPGEDSPGHGGRGVPLSPTAEPPAVLGSVPPPPLPSSRPTGARPQPQRRPQTASARPTSQLPAAGAARGAGGARVGRTRSSVEAIETRQLSVGLSGHGNARGSGSSSDSIAACAAGARRVAPSPPQTQSGRGAHLSVCTIAPIFD